MNLHLWRTINQAGGIQGYRVSAHHEQARGGVVRDGVDDADIPAADPAVSNLQGRDDVGGCGSDIR